MQGYPCEGTGEEVKTCNEKKCPGRGCPTPQSSAPHTWAVLTPPFPLPSLPRDVQGRVRDADDLEEDGGRGDHLQQMSPQCHR